MNRPSPAAPLALAALLAAGPALACMPGGLTAGGPVKGPDCAVSQVVNEYFTVGLDAARDFTAGVVVQRTFESNGCGAEQTLIVHLCGQDIAVILGTEESHAMLAPEDMKNHGALDGYEKWLRQQTRKKKMPTPAALTAEAKARGLDLALEVPVSGQISMGGKRFSLACGCKTYYPGA
jgi:hypothetical protein